MKSARAGNVTISESFIQLELATGKIWLKNAYFAPYQIRRRSERNRGGDYNSR